jgi:hypothetical protein
MSRRGIPQLPPLEGLENVENVGQNVEVGQAIDLVTVENASADRKRRYHLFESGLINQEAVTEAKIRREVIYEEMAAATYPIVQPVGVVDMFAQLQQGIAQVQETQARILTRLDLFEIKLENQTVKFTDIFYYYLSDSLL